MYTYPIEPEAMFEDRAAQFVGFGIPAEDVARLRSTITDMWLVGPGGWVHEWSALAAGYADQGNPLLASLAYGCAKFPCLADAQRGEALSKQVEQYLAASPQFPVQFERVILALDYQGASIDVPVHLFSSFDDRRSRPVLLLGGGVDTWKMDIHSLCISSALHSGTTVLAFDIPGTGESSHIPLNADADEIVLGIATAAKGIGNGKVGHLALSFGGNFSAMTGLTGAVDAAVNNGGPIKDSFTVEHLTQLPYGMLDIVGNAIGFDAQPTIEQIVAGAGDLSRAGLLEAAPTNSPMLVINGADDHFIPQSDTLVFHGRPHTEVHLIDGTGHCAMSKLDTVIPLMVGWMRGQLAG